MLQEILLSLSGHPSPLLRNPASPEADALAGITPPERQLLSSAGHLSDLVAKLAAYSAEVSASHASTICRAVATAVRAVHLDAFREKVLEVERGILRDDPEWVGAYNIVPLTAVMGEFQQWTRRLEWLWDTVRFVMAAGSPCRGAALIDRLRDEMQSGYRDVADAARSLVCVAETAWLKQVSAWVLYGRLPTFGTDDFFVQRAPGPAEDYICAADRLPSFVTGATAASMLFIGKSLNHVRAMNSASGADSAPADGAAHVSAKLSELSRLSFPLESADFSKAIKAIRVSLSQNTLQKMLPLARVAEMMQLLRDFFLLGRGEFAMALTQEADERVRNRWRRAGNPAQRGRDQGWGGVAVRDGEVAAVLSRTWAVLVSLQGQHADEDEQLDLARSLVELHLTRSKPPAALMTGRGLDVEAANLLAASPFRSMLFSAPAALSLEVPPPLDMVISASDVQLYSCINSYLLAMRRAHIRLTDLWKSTSLRRHCPAPRGASDGAAALRERWSHRAWLLRSSWTTASAAIFFLGETETYLQTEIVQGSWDSFQGWLLGDPDRDRDPKPAPDPAPAPAPAPASADPQALAAAHTLYLRTLVRRLLLTQPSFTQPLHALLTHIDRLVAHMHRLHALFTSLDLERDAGAPDASAHLAREQAQVLASLRSVEHSVKRGIRAVVDALRALETDPDLLADGDGSPADDGLDDDDDAAAAAAAAAAPEERAPVPGRLGGVDRLLMKLDFGSWIGQAGGEEDWGVQ